MSEVNVGKDSIIKIIDLLRRQCFKYYVKNPLVLGGDDIIIQIDESSFRHKQKYHFGENQSMKSGCLN
ncbi:hypothetical protein HERIO_2164 [Hepatospora eriocheir]|uniref:Uncharacterized protein n=1 Tax=Hepatospora eriocheir TaxID=1081669 RepID=A0A1X0Q7Y4_9MICR|nr:hypothetical protein HERIO_2164 [Hepatospora eriocheir]